MSKPHASPEHRATVRDRRLQGGRLVTSRVFMTLLADEVARAWRYDRMFSIALARLDTMDRPGGGALTAADIELTLLEFLAGHLRAPDKIALLGHGEFGVLLPEASQRHSGIAAQRLCDRVAAATFRARGLAFTATVSIGAATLSHRVRTAGQLLMAGRQEWRRAQARGGNCIAAMSPLPYRIGPARSTGMH